MTIKEAIKLLHPDTTGEGIMELEYYGGFEAKEKVIKEIEEACILACAALEKQIPKKVLEIFKIDNTIKGGKCPNCNMHINNSAYWKYCECGQRIDWKVEE